MKRSIFAWLWPAAGIVLLASVSARADDVPIDPADPTATEGAAAEPSADNANGAVSTVSSPYRPLAPWVMQTIDPMRSLGETVSYHDLVEVLAVDPKLKWAKDAAFRYDVWTLEFKFKPVRMIWIDSPRSDGHMERKLIWYMVYSVTNTGKIFHPVADVKPEYKTFDNKQFFEVKSVDRPIRFVPEFVMDTFQRQPGDMISNKVYPDRVLPVAMAAIRLREDPNRQFLSTVEMCRDIDFGETLWGIATWEDIDLTTYKFSVLVSGLTNTYRWKDRPGEFKPGDAVPTGRALSRKTLKLNFWRPADKFHPDEEEIRYGLPDGVDYEWVYQ